MLLWAGTFIAGRMLAGTVYPVDAAFLRFVIATLALAVFARVIEGKIPVPSKKQLLPLIFLGISGVFCYNILFFTGLEYIDAGRAALIIALNPLVITVAAVAFLGERLGASQFFGILISFIGAIFVISNGQPSVLFSKGIGIGEAAIFGCVISWAIYSLIGKVVLKSLSPLAAVFYSSFFGMLLLFPCSLFSTNTATIFSYTLKDWLSLTFLGIFGTAVGFSLYYLAIRNIGASRASVFINLIPFFAILLAWILLDESIKPSVLIGGMLLISGVYLTNRR